MTERLKTEQRELDDLFERYRAAPKGHVFAPLADACRKAGMLEEALEICARGVGEHPRYASGYVVQGKCLYDAGRARDAQAAFDRVLELDPKNLVALKFLGIISSERGDIARAREYFGHILALDPGDREIRSRMEDVSHQNSKVAAASPVLIPVAETETGTGTEAPVVTAPEVASDEEAVTLPDLEDESFEGEPITLRDEVVTSDEIATMTLADIYASQGYSSRALKIYREVLKRQPGNRELAAKVERLETSERELEAQRAKAAASIPVVETPKPAAAENSAEPRVAPQAPPSPATVPTGHPIDPSRNYEQFKRWLKTSSR